MSLESDCPSCMAGNHEGHVEPWDIHEGLIGGSYCACAGDCADRSRAAFAAMFGGLSKSAP